MEKKLSCTLLGLFNNYVINEGKWEVPGWMTVDYKKGLGYW